MAYPDKADQLFSFTGFSSTSPEQQQPGAKIDAEFNEVRFHLDEVVDFLEGSALSSTGRLNTLTVTLDQLDTDLVAAIWGDAAPDFSLYEDEAGAARDAAQAAQTAAETAETNAETAETAAETAQAAAEAARDTAQDAAGGFVEHFKTKSDAQAQEIDADFLHALLLEPRAFYTRVDSEPSHELKFRSADRFKADGSSSAADGGWWEINPEGAAINVLHAGATGDGTTDDTTAIDNAKAAAAALDVALTVPKGSYLYSGTVYEIDASATWIDKGFTIPINVLKELAGKNLLVTASTADTSPLDADEGRVPIGVTVEARGSHHASGVRSNLNNSSDDGNGNTAFYGRASNLVGANWGAAVHGETRHEDGTSIALSAEAASYGTIGGFFGAVINNSTNSAETTHPISGAAKAEHPDATGLLVQGSRATDPMGAWRLGIDFGPDSIRALGSAIQQRSPVNYSFNVTATAVAAQADILLNANSQVGLVCNGAYTSGNAIRVPSDQAIAFENTGAKKLRWSSADSSFEFVSGNVQIAKTQPALWWKDGASVADARLAGDSLIFRRNQAAAANDFANFRFDRTADYTGAGSGGVSSNVRIFTDVAATAGDGVTTEPEWALNTRIDSASDNANAVAVSGQARRDAAGAVWAGHFNAIDNTNPTATKATRAIEGNIQADGADSNDLRTVLDVIAHNTSMTYGAGADNIARGIRVVADSADFKTGLEITEFSGAITGAAIKINTSGANAIVIEGTYGSGNAIEIPSDQAIAFEGTGAKRMRYEAGGEKVAFLDGATERAAILMGATPVLQIGGQTVVRARKTGWTNPTGTATRTAFDTTTVTTPQLAERVKALIDDLHIGSTGHGLLG